MTLAIRHALRTSERATQLLSRFQTAPRLSVVDPIQPAHLTGKVVNVFSMGTLASPFR